MKRVIFLLIVSCGMMAAQTMQPPIKTSSVNNVITVQPVSNDFAAPLQAAIANCGSAGCTIHIPATSGTRNLSAAIQFNQPNTHLVCDSTQPLTTTYSTTPIAGNGTYYLGPLDITANNVEVSGCALDVSSLGILGLNAIHIYGASGVKVHGNVITSSTTPQWPAMLGIRAEGYLLSGACSSTAVGAEIYGNTVQVPGIAFSTGDCSKDINFHDNRASGNFECLDFNGSDTTVPTSTVIKFRGNTCAGNIASSYVESALDVLIEGNHFLGEGSTSLPSLRVHAITSTIDLHTVINDNEFIGSASTSTAIQLFQNAGSIQVTNNKIRNMGTDGITLDSTSGTPSNFMISGNTLTSNGQQGAGGNYCGIRLHQSSGNNVSYGSIRNNDFSDRQSTQTQLSGICSDGGQAPYKLHIADNNFVLYGATATPLNLPNGCTNCTIGPNVLDGSGNSEFSGGISAVTVTAGTIVPTTPIAVANGGTGTATPSLVAGPNVTIAGSWPNQTVSSSGGSFTPAGSSGDLQTNNGSGGVGSVPQSTFASAPLNAIVVSSCPSGLLTLGTTTVIQSSVSCSMTLPTTSVVQGSWAAATAAKGFSSVTVTPLSGTLLLNGVSVSSVTILPEDNAGFFWTGTQYIVAMHTQNPTLASASIGTSTPTVINNAGITTPTVTAGTIVPTTPIAVANGGTGTATPSLVAGPNVTIAGSWPNQTVSASGGGGSSTTFETSGAQLIGDSWMNEGGAVWPSQGLGNLLCQKVGGVCTNLSVSGSMAPDMAIGQLWPNVQNTYTYPLATIIEAGVNDANSGGVNYEQNYQYTLQGMVAQAAIPVTNKVWANNATISGTATSFTAVPGIQGSQSTTNGTSWTFTVGYGTKVDVAWWASDSNGGTASLSIDGGAATDTLLAYGLNSTNIVTGNGATTTIFDKEYTVPTASSHTVVITVTSATGAGNKFAPIFAATPTVLATASQPTVYVYGVPYENADTKSTTTAAFNTIAQNVAAIYRGDGLPVYFVPVRNFMNFTTDMTTTVTNLSGVTVVDGVSTTGGSATTITSATANFGPSVVPPNCTAQNLAPCWPINISGAGASGVALNALIVGYVSPTQVVINTPALTAASGETVIFGAPGSVACGGNVAPLYANCAGIMHAVDAFNSVALPILPSAVNPQFQGTEQLLGTGLQGSLYATNMPTSSAYQSGYAMLEANCQTGTQPTWANGGTVLGINTCTGTNPNVFDVRYAGGASEFSIFRDGTLTTTAPITSTATAVMKVTGTLTNTSGNPTIKIQDDAATPVTCPLNGSILCVNVAPTSNARLFDWFINATEESYIDRQGIFGINQITAIAPLSPFLNLTGAALGANTIIKIQDSAATNVACVSTILCVNVAATSNDFFLNFYNNATQEFNVFRTGDFFALGTGTVGNIIDSGVAASTPVLATNSSKQIIAASLSGAGTTVQTGLSIPNGTPTYTAGTNVTSVACASGYTCTNTRGELTIVGGTATTGTIATVNFSATLASAPGLCIVTQNGGATLFGLGHGTPSTTAFTVTAGITVSASTVTVDYQCQP